MSGRNLLRRVALLSCVLAVALPTAAASGRGRPGTLDPSFGHRGRSVLKLGDAFSVSLFAQVFQQPDRKIVVAGGLGTKEQESGVIERRQPNGELDAGFGNGGEVLVPASVVGEVGDGRVLLFYELHHDYGRGREQCPVDTLSRLTADGAKDESFGTDGCSPEIPFQVAQAVSTADGHIYLLGGHYYGPIQGTRGTPPNEEMALARLLPDGSLDRSFGKEGIFFTHTYAGLELEELIGGKSPNPVELTGMAPTADGGVTVAAGRAVLRFTPTGTLDSSFGKGGIAELAGVSGDLLALPDGRLVVASCCGSTEPISLTRLLPDGSPDPSFGQTGTSTLDDAALLGPVAIAALPDGSLMVAAGGRSRSCDPACEYPLVLTRRNPDGSPDKSYGEGGTIEASGCTAPRGNSALAVEADGRAIVAGTTGGFGDACLTASDASGRLDRGFGRDGYATLIHPEPSGAEAKGIAIEPTGEIAVTASSDAGVHEARPVLLDARANGALDRRAGSGTGFGSIPELGELRSGGGRRLFSIAHRRGGERVVAFDRVGRIDRAYGSRGEASLPAGFRARFFRVGPDGSVLVFGRFVLDNRMTIFRFNPTGHPDRGFGKEGERILGFGPEVSSSARSATVEPDGRIVLVGQVRHAAAAVRLLPDGRFDPSFGRRGRVLRLLGPRSAGTTVLARRRGGIVIGCVQRGKGERRTVLVGLDGRGRRDRSFGRRGVVRVAVKTSPFAMFGEGRRIVLFTARGDWFERHGLVARAFGPRGAVDRGFGTGGKTDLSLKKGTEFSPVAAARQRDGRIVIAGTASSGIESRVELLRLR